eukprot:evm.model.scf_1250.2 EVM.evm.TU.scf_1250.2   scf_1250:5774-9632(-)
MPREYARFVDAFKSASPGPGAPPAGPSGPNLWIAKPVGSSRGRGIAVVHDPHQVSLGDPVVVQRYISNPLLIGCHKFDLRLYVLVTSFNPLEAWLYREGFARFATEEFGLQAERLGNPFVHLTNSSIQQFRDGEGTGPGGAGGACIGGDFEDGGNKWSLRRTWKALEELGIDKAEVWRRITDVVVAALFVGQDAIPNQVNSFELFGFDVLIDESLKPWLLEINSSPSLSCRSRLDREIKEALISDVLSVVDPPPFDRQKLLQAVQNRLDAAQAKSAATESNQRPQDWNDAIEEILHGRLPRQYGQLPACMGQFELVAPSKTLEVFMGLKRPLPARDL